MICLCTGSTSWAQQNKIVQPTRASSSTTNGNTVAALQPPSCYTSDRAQDEAETARRISLGLFLKCLPEGRPPPLGRVSAAL